LRHRKLPSRIKPARSAGTERLPPRASWKCRRHRPDPQWCARPCPCGFLGHYSGRCHCTPDQVTRYRNRISGPLLDRIDLHIEVPAVPEKDLGSRQSGESSAAIRERVTAARARQLARQGKPNAHLSVKEVGEHCIAEADADQLARKAISALGLSARAYHRILMDALPFCHASRSSLKY
jgi:predicted ATPase with chaperone activity